MLMEFDVALWLAWPSLFLEQVAIIEVSDPLSSVWLLMESCQLLYIVREGGPTAGWLHSSLVLCALSGMGEGGLDD